MLDTLKYFSSTLNNYIPKEVYFEYVTITIIFLIFIKLLSGYFVKDSYKILNYDFLYIYNNFFTEEYKELRFRIKALLSTFFFYIFFIILFRDEIIFGEYQDLYTENIISLSCLLSFNYYFLFFLLVFLFNYFLILFIWDINEKLSNFFIIFMSFLVSVLSFYYLFVYNSLEEVDVTLLSFTNKTNFNGIELFRYIDNLFYTNAKPNTEPTIYFVVSSPFIYGLFQDFDTLLQVESIRDNLHLELVPIDFLRSSGIDILKHDLSGNKYTLKELNYVYDISQQPYCLLSDKYNYWYYNLFGIMPETVFTNLIDSRYLALTNNIIFIIFLICILFLLWNWFYSVFELFIDYIDLGSMLLTRCYYYLSIFLLLLFVSYMIDDIYNHLCNLSSVFRYYV